MLDIPDLLAPPPIAMISTSKVQPIDTRNEEEKKEEKKEEEKKKDDGKKKEEKKDDGKKKKHELMNGNPDDDEDEFEIPLESKIAKTLSDRTTKIVIILVLVMLFSLQLF